MTSQLPLRLWVEGPRQSSLLFSRIISTNSIQLDLCVPYQPYLLDLICNISQTSTSLPIPLFIPLSYMFRSKFKLALHSTDCDDLIILCIVIFEFHLFHLLWISVWNCIKIVYVLLCLRKVNGRYCCCYCFEYTDILSGIRKIESMYFGVMAAFKSHIDVFLVDWHMRMCLYIQIGYQTIAKLLSYKRLDRWDHWSCRDAVSRFFWPYDTGCVMAACVG